MFGIHVVAENTRRKHCLSVIVDPRNRNLFLGYSPNSLYNVRKSTTVALVNGLPTVIACCIDIVPVLSITESCTDDTGESWEAIREMLGFRCTTGPETVLSNTDSCTENTESRLERSVR